MPLKSALKVIDGSAEAELTPLIKPTLALAHTSVVFCSGNVALISQISEILTFSKTGRDGREVANLWRNNASCRWCRCLYRLCFLEKELFVH